MNEEEYEGLKRYLKLEILNNCKVINEQELEEIDYLTKFDSVKELVDARKKLEEGLITEAEFDKIHDYYRYAVAKPEEEFDEADFELIRNEVPTYTDGIISRNELDEVVSRIEGNNSSNIIREYAGLAHYFELDNLRKESYSDELNEKIENLSLNNEMVDRLEKARKLLEEGKIARESYDALKNFYRSELEGIVNN